MNLRALPFLALLLTVMDSTAQPISPATATNALGLDIYRIEAAAGTGNVLLSPYSIESALAMTLGGADGKTREEMVRVLHLGADANKAPEQFASLRRALEKAAADSQKRTEEVKKYGGSLEPLQLRVAN